MSNREDQARERRPMMWIILGTAACLFAAAFWLNASPPDSTASPEDVAVESQRNEPAPTLGVDAHTVSASDARIIVDVAGVLSARRMVDIAAEVEGRVDRVAIEDHTAISAGDLIVELDSELTEAAVMRAKAALLRAQSANRLAQSEVKRQRDLQSRGASSSSALDRAESEASGSDAQVAESRAALVEARTRLAKTKVKAPFSGTVSAIGVDPGAYIRPGDRIAQLADLSEIEIEVGVGEQEILALRDGADVLVSVDAVPGRWFKGRIDRTGRLPDPKTRKYPVPVRVPNSDGLLLPGMLGTVRFELGEQHSSIRIPRRAVVREFDLEYVFILEAESQPDVASVERRRVVSARVGFRPDLLEIKSGIEPGERIAISDIHVLKDGIRVRTTDREPAELAGNRPPDSSPVPERPSGS